MYIIMYINQRAFTQDSWGGLDLKDLIFPGAFQGKVQDSNNSIRNSRLLRGLNAKPTGLISYLCPGADREVWRFKSPAVRGAKGSTEARNRKRGSRGTRWRAHRRQGWTGRRRSASSPARSPAGAAASGRGTAVRAWPRACRGAWFPL
jgi:hypothetical protein